MFISLYAIIERFQACTTPRITSGEAIDNSLPILLTTDYQKKCLAVKSGIFINVFSKVRKDTSPLASELRFEDVHDRCDNSNGG
jgi:hypothetical protein